MEEWRDIPGWEGIYRVSSEGRVQRLPRFVKTKGGSFRLHKGGKISGNLTAAGYRNLDLVGEGRRQRIGLHEAVCAAFHGDKPGESHQVRHLDGVPSHNSAANLAWGTPKENAADRELHGTDPKGERAGNSRLKDADILAIRAAYAPKYGSLSRLAREYGVTPTQILNIVSRRQWAHI